MNILIIDDDDFYRKIVRKYLARDLPDAVLIDYDLKSHGSPTANFDWSSYDVLLLDYVLGRDDQGSHWLEAFADDVTFPATILLTSDDDQRVNTKAAQLGADDYINKHELVGERLAKLIDEVVSRRASPDWLEQTQRRKRSVWHALAAREAAQAVALPTAASLQPDEFPTPSVDGYAILSQIGKGALSRVYLAERKIDSLTVVLKVMDADFSDGHVQIQRFVQEAEFLAEVHSPHVVTIFQHGFSEDCCFMCLEFFPRGDLKHRIEMGLSPADAVHCVANIAYALDAIHKVGIVHRDVKPANVMFRHDDSLALADFGISAKIGGSVGVIQSTAILGTPHYMSPQQVQGGVIDHRNDLYSLGVVFYEMLAGIKPFTGDSPEDLLLQHLNKAPPPLPDGLRRYQQLLDRLLAKQPEQRFQSAQDLLNAL